MPRINRGLIRKWLEEHNWTSQRLAQECSALGDDTISPDTMRNVVNGIDPMRPSRIRLICKVTAMHGDGISYGRLIAENDDAQGLSKRLSTISRVLANILPLLDYGPEHSEFLARHVEIIRKLVRSCQSAVGAIDHYDDGKLTARTLRIVGHELVTLASELTTLGIDMSRPVNKLDEPVGAPESGSGVDCSDARGQTPTC